VFVPEGVKPTDSVPVLAWWYGGAYVIGEKSLSGSPGALLENTAEPMIVVAANYR
jgi:carboxylesterase type B